MDADELKRSTVENSGGCVFIGSPYGDEIVRIGNDGTVTVNPKYTVDEAARAFWEAVLKISVDAKRKAMQ